MRTEDFKSPSGAPVTVKREPRRTLQHHVHAGPAWLLHARLAAAHSSLRINTSAEEAICVRLTRTCCRRNSRRTVRRTLVAGAEEFEELAKAAAVSLHHGRTGISADGKRFSVTIQEGGGVNTRGLLNLAPSRRLRVRLRLRLGAGNIMNPPCPHNIVSTRFSRFRCGVIAAGDAVLQINIYLRVGKVIDPWRNIFLLVFRVAASCWLSRCCSSLRGRNRCTTQQERVTPRTVDTSLSMKQRDAERATRLDAAKNLLVDSARWAATACPKARASGCLNSTLTPSRSKNPSSISHRRATRHGFTSPSPRC